MRSLLFVLPLIFALPASACLNDRDSDSLAVQAAKFPDTLRVITGRFERNPPLYYQMRIRRELAQLQKTPREFGLYDDIAVAFDHLNRDDEALQIMAKKRAVLPPFDAKNSAQKEAWYRYYANAGTFHAHRYLGQKSGDLSEMKVARNMIARAIEIKPNAHFGREKVQLLAMDWIVAVRNNQTYETLGQWMNERDDWTVDPGGINASETYENGVLTASNPGSKADSPAQIAQKQARRRQAIEGLSGLIVLGAAWENVDVFWALAQSLGSDSITLRYMALKRCEELLQHGKKSLASAKTKDPFLEDRDVSEDLWKNFRYIRINERNKKTLDTLYSKLRREADSWDAARNAYMLPRLKAGRHPDTDATFWNGWKPSAPPSLEVAWINQKQARNRVLLSMLLVLVGIFVALRRRASRRRAA